jgi:glycosyltransferase involved in cell wall biosynthesis
MPLGSPLSLSFVIVNKDDRGVIATLEALQRLVIDPGWVAETLVVDASDGRLDDIRSRFPEVRWIPFTGSSEKPTIPEQRNVGVSNSRGAIIVFIDASCVPDPGWLPALIRPLADEGELIVAGANRSAGKRGIRDEAARFVAGSRYIREAPSLNLAVARQVFQLIGEFDETFHYGSDVDFTWRAVDAGCRIRYVPDAVVAHDWGTFRSELRRSFLYGQARYRLYAKHPQRRGDAWLDDPEAVAYPLFLVIAPLAFISRWIAALLAIPLVKNARHQPLLTVTHNLVYGAGVLTAVGRGLNRRARPWVRRCCHLHRRSGGGRPTS